LPALEHHTYREDDVEEGGTKIKRKKLIFVHENGNFFFFIPNHHFWISEG
jgi:hypothetical protein